MGRLRLAGAKVFEMVELREQPSAFRVDGLDGFTDSIAQSLRGGFRTKINDELTTGQRCFQPKAQLRDEVASDQIDHSDVCKT